MEKRGKFEEKFQQLNDIVDALDAGVTFDESLQMFEKGVRLSKECMDILQAGQGKITEIKKSLDALTESPLDLEGAEENE